jgi:hypothetical protein
MAQSYTKKAEGVGTVSLPDGSSFDTKTITCGHCQRICPVLAGTDGTGEGLSGPMPGLAARKRPGTHVCHICWRIVCDKCHAVGVCAPWEEQMQRTQARDRFLRSAGLCAVVLLALSLFSTAAIAAPKPAPAPVSAELVATPDPEPAAPQVSGGGHSVSLSWTASIDAAANPSLTYSVYRATGSCTATFTKINTNVTLSVYTDPSMQPGSYCYKVTSVLNGAESVFSNSASAVILPAPPTNAAVTGTT